MRIRLLLAVLVVLALPSALRAAPKKIDDIRTGTYANRGTCTAAVPGSSTSGDGERYRVTDAASSDCAAGGGVVVCTLICQDGAWTKIGTGGGGGLGDVVGPASATDDHVAIFDGETGKLLKDGGALPITTTEAAPAVSGTTLCTAVGDLHQDTSTSPDTWAVCQTASTTPPTATGSVWAPLLDYPVAASEPGSPAAGLHCYAFNDGTSDRLYCKTASGTVQKITINSDSLGTIDDTEMTPESFGDFTCTGQEDGCTLNSTLERLVYAEAASCSGWYAEPLWDESTTLAMPTSECMSGTNINRAVADFTDSVDRGMCRTFRTPPGLAASPNAVKAEVDWVAAATTGNVVWAIQTACVNAGDTIDPALNTASTVTAAVNATSGRLNEAQFSSVTSTNCAAGQLMTLCVSRDADNASDTMASDARVLGVELSFVGGMHR